MTESESNALMLQSYSAGIEHAGKRIGVVEDIDLLLAPGEIMALVGESGSGKSFLCRSLFGIDGGWRSGAAIVEDVDLMRCAHRSYEDIGGRRAAMIFQNPVSNLDPMMTVGRHLTHSIKKLHGLAGQNASKRAQELLEKVGLGSDDSVLQAYPHQLSGGMNQRVMIALALAGAPKLLIADEPTTALDVTIQQQILDLLQKLAREENMAMLLITHDLNIAHDYADRLAVLYAGKIVETGQCQDVLGNPRHPYSQALIACTPSLSEPRKIKKIPGRMPSIIDRPDGCVFTPRCAFASEKCTEQKPSLLAEGEHSCACWHPSEQVLHTNCEPDLLQYDAASPASQTEALLAVENLTVAYRARRTFPYLQPGVAHQVLNNVSLSLGRGEILGIIGESGSGKSTLAKAIMGLVEPTSGQIRWSKNTGSKTLKLQMVFQDAAGSLNPHFSAIEAVKDCLDVNNVGTAKNRPGTAGDLLAKIDLPAGNYNDRRDALSGGQAQRVAIARAISTRPDILVCDEPTSALDVSVQAQIIDLLRTIRAETEVGIIFISHDLAVVRSIADHIAVMFAGNIVESGPTNTILKNPAHPYTRRLIDAVPGQGNRARSDQSLSNANSDGQLSYNSSIAHDQGQTSDPERAAASRSHFAFRNQPAAEGV